MTRAKPKPLQFSRPQTFLLVQFVPGENIRTESFTAHTFDEARQHARLSPHEASDRYLFWMNPEQAILAMRDLASAKGVEIEFRLTPPDGPPLRKRLLP